jgi:hypothetical protein
MHKYKFLSLLDALSEKEFKSFGKFISSPFFNESKKMLELYWLIKIFFLSRNLKNLSLEKISDSIYKKYDYTKTRKLVSDFSLLLEDFLIHSSVESDAIGKRMYLFQRLINEESGNYEIGSISKLNDISVSDGKSFYFLKLKLAGEDIAAKKFSLHTAKLADKITDFAGAIDKQYFFLKLHLYHLLIQNDFQNENEILNYGFTNQDRLFGYIEKNAELFRLSEPRIYLYYFVLKLIKGRKTEGIYRETENIIEQNRKFLNPSDNGFIMQSVITYIINEINLGKYDRPEIIPDIFGKIKAKGYFEKLKDLNYKIFIETVHFAVLTNNPGFAEYFIWDYYKKINSGIREDSLNLALAMLRFEQGRYGETRDHLMKIENRSYIFYLISNSLLLKIYFEENSLKYIRPPVDSFRHFLKRNKTVPQYYKISFSLFLNYLTKLTSVKKGSVKDVLKIEYLLSNEKYFYGKKWVEEKLRIMSR